MIGSSPLKPLTGLDFTLRSAPIGGTGANEYTVEIELVASADLFGADPQTYFRASSEFSGGTEKDYDKASPYIVPVNDTEVRSAGENGTFLVVIAQPIGQDAA